MSSLHIVVLAAGESKRFKSTTPKVLHLLGGKPLLSHLLENIQGLHYQDLYVVYHAQSELIQDTFAQFSTKWVLQEQRLGTAHAVAQVMPRLAGEGRVLILLGDVPLITQRSLEHLLAKTPLDGIGLLTAEMHPADGLARIIRNKSGEVIGIVEEKDASPDQLLIQEVNSGLLLASVANLTRWLPKVKNNNAQGEYYLTELISLCVQEGRPIYALRSDSAWEIQGVNDREQLAKVERIYQSQIAKSLMQSGVTLKDPNRFDARGELSISSDVSLDINIILEGKIAIGMGTTIGPNVLIKNSVIGAQVQIFAHSIIENTVIEDHAIIDPNVLIKNSSIGARVQILGHSDIVGAAIEPDCSVGPFARIRPGTVLKSGARVGNFVEIKNSNIGSQSKINHLSYVGDANLGQEVNIGAGSITCNYDGWLKHRTAIGNKVKIGSNSTLVAPVTIADHAYIAAGTTVRQDVPQGALVFNPRTEVTRADWVTQKELNITAKEEA